MSILFIQQSIDKERRLFTGYYDSLSGLYQRHRHIVSSMFPNSLRLQKNLTRQGFSSILIEEFNLEYRIEVQQHEKS